MALNKDIILKDTEDTKLYPLAHRDSNGDIIEDTYLKKADQGYQNIIITVGEQGEEITNLINATSNAFSTKYAYGYSPTIHPDDSDFIYTQQPPRVEGLYIWKRSYPFSMESSQGSTEPIYEMIQALDSSNGTNYFQNSLPYTDDKNYASSGIDNSIPARLWGFSRNTSNGVSAIDDLANNYWFGSFSAGRSSATGGNYARLLKPQKYDNVVRNALPILNQLKVGDCIAISYEVWADRTISTRCYCYTKVSTSAVENHILDTSETDIIQTNTWTTVYKTGVVTQAFIDALNNTNCNYASFEIEINDDNENLSDNVNYRIRKCQFEIGYASTPWTAAPEDLYLNTVSLSANNNIFTSDDEGRTKAENYILYVTSYKGNTQIFSRIGTITTPTGMSATITNNNSTSPYITISVEADKNISAGTLTIPVTADNITFNKLFTYSWVKDGVSGAGGRGIQEVLEYYTATSTETPVPVRSESSPWQQTVPVLDSTNKYLWNFEKVVYTSPPHTTTPVALIGVYGDDGRSIIGVENYYLATTASAGVTKETSGWTRQIQFIDETNKYLWNYEKIIFSRPVESSESSEIEIDYEETEPAIIGTYGDTGNGISSIVITYTVTEEQDSPDPDSSEVSWYDYVPEMSSTDKYLWKKIITTYTNGEAETIVELRAIFGDTGEAGVDGYNTASIYLYQRTSEEPELLPEGDLTYNFRTRVLTVPAGSTLNGWSQELPSRNSANDPLWLTLATASSDEVEDTIPDTEWQDPVMLAENGADGLDGYNQATINLYIRADVAPSRPFGNSTTLKSSSYTFSTGTFSPVPTGWSLGLPDADNSVNQPCFISSVSVFSRDDVIWIINSAWSEPSKIAENGIGIERINYTYMLTSTNQAPEENDSHWSPTIPTTDNINRFMWQKEEIIYSDDNSEHAHRKVTITLKAAQGQAGVNQTVINLYQRSSSKPTLAPTLTTYDFSNKSLSLNNITGKNWNGWSTTIPVDDGNPCWLISATASSTTSTDEIEQSEWNPKTGNPARLDPIKFVVSGSSITIDSVMYISWPTGSGTPPSESENWTSTIPEVPEGYFLWTRTEYSDNTYTYTASRQGSNGTSISIGSQSVMYARSISGSTIPDENYWKNTPQATGVQPGQYLWTRTIVNYVETTDSSEEIPAGSTTSYSISYIGRDGEDGSSVYIESTSKIGDVTTIVLAETIPGSSEIIEHTIEIRDGQEGPEGREGESGYIHIAWANSQDGQTDFTTVNDPDSSEYKGPYLYMGVYSDHTLEDSQDPDDYSWTLIKGEDGTNGNNTATVYIYKQGSTSVEVGRPSGDLIYNFNTKTLRRSQSSSDFNGWSTDIPNSSTTPTWIMAAVASSNRSEDTIEPSEWNGGNNNPAVKFSQDGNNGTTPIIYSVEVVPTSIIRNTNSSNVLLPSSLNITNIKQEGNTLSQYRGRLVIEYSTDGSTWETPALYDGETDSYTYNIPSTTPGPFTAKSFRISLYNANNTSVLLDQQTIPVLDSGKNGTNATQYYTYIKYATDNQGSNMSDTPTANTRYVGTYAGTVQNPAANLYKWSEYVGTSYYIFIKYAPTDDISEDDMSSTPRYDTKYIGIYTGTLSQAPSTKSSYEWSAYVGEDGQDGAPGEPAYTVLLSNDNQSFIADETGHALSADTTGKVEVYKGSTKINAVIDTANISYVPREHTGLTVTVPASAGLSNDTFKISVTTRFDTTSGTITFPIIADSKTFTKTFSYSLVSNGTNGINAATVYLYKASDTMPAKPTGQSKYTFSSGNIEAYNGGNLNNWSKEQPASGTVWMIMAEALSADSYDIINANEWNSNNDPIKITGNDSTSYSLVVTPESIIKDVNNNNSLSSEKITVTAYKQTGNNAQQSFTSGTLEVKKANDTTISPDSGSTSVYTVPTDTDYLTVSLYYDSGKTILLDRQTIPIISTGANSYTVSLSNDNHTFPANKNGYAYANSVTITVTAYKGSTKVATSIGTITGKPSGLTTTVYNNNTTNTSIKIDVNTSMNTANGLIIIPITAAGELFNKGFSYSLANTGSDGYPGSQYWTTTVQPTTSSGNYIFTKSNLVGDSSNTEVKVGDLIFYSYDRYTVSSVSSTTVTANNKQNLRGSQGEHGYNRATITLYKRTSDVASDGTVTGPTENVNYNFSTGSITGNISGNDGITNPINTGWYREIPRTDGNPCYEVRASAISISSTFDITSWSDPIKLVEDGLNQATISFYKRNAGGAPTDNPGTITYTFNPPGVSPTTQNGWSYAIPSGTDPCYVRRAAAVSTSNSATLSTWSSATKILENGINSAEITLYQRKNGTAPSVPSERITYTFSNGALYGNTSGKNGINGALNSGWYKTLSAIPAANASYPCYVTTARALGTGATDDLETSDWAAVAKYVENGKDADPAVGIQKVEPVYIMLLSTASVPSTPQQEVTTSTNTPGVWSLSPPMYIDTSESSEYEEGVTYVYYTCTQIHYTNNPSNPVGWSDVIRITEFERVNSAVATNSSEISNIYGSITDMATITYVQTETSSINEKVVDVNRIVSSNSKWIEANTNVIGGLISSYDAVQKQANDTDDEVKELKTISSELNQSLLTIEAGTISLLSETIKEIKEEQEQIGTAFRVENDGAYVYNGTKRERLVTNLFYLTNQKEPPELPISAVDNTSPRPGAWTKVIPEPEESSEGATYIYYYTCQQIYYNDTNEPDESLKEHYFWNSLYLVPGVPTSKMVKVDSKEPYVSIWKDKYSKVDTSGLHTFVGEDNEVAWNTVEGTGTKMITITQTRTDSARWQIRESGDLLNISYHTA